MNRKDEHLDISIRQYIENMSENNFEKMKLKMYNIPMISEKEVCTKTSIQGYELDFPFYINAMTGGSQKALEINEKLAYISSKTKIFMFTGSYSEALKNNYVDSFDVIKQYIREYGGNIGIDKGILNIQKVYDEFKPKLLQVHINALQEYLMTEGDKNFDTWYETLKQIKNLNIPIIIKEVGFGVNSEMMEKFIELGIKTVDISGSGGTNFYNIENVRSGKNKYYLENLGIKTLDSLLENQKYIDKIEILASGGIKNPLDIIKCLVLGAKACGISSHILYLIERYEIDEVVSIIEEYKKDIVFIMTLLGVKNLKELRGVKYTLNE